MRSELQGVIIFWVWAQTVPSWLTAKVLHHCIDPVAIFCVHTNDVMQPPGDQFFKGTSQFVFAPAPGLQAASCSSPSHTDN